MRTTTSLALLISAILCVAAAADNGVTVHTSSINTPEGYILMDDDPTLHIQVSSTLRRSDAGGATEDVRIRYTVMFVPQGGGPAVGGGSHVVIHEDITGFYNQPIADDVFSFPAERLTDLDEYDIQVSIAHDDGTGVFVNDESPNSVQRIGHFQVRLDFGGGVLVNITGFSFAPVWLAATQNWQVQINGGTLLGADVPVGTSIITPTLEVDLDKFGKMDVVSGQVRVFTAPEFDMAGFPATRGGLTLVGIGGVTTNQICFDLPPGIGWRENAIGFLDKQLCTALGGSIPLSAADLQPTAAFSGTFSGGTPEIVADAFPLLFDADVWTFDNGILSIPTPDNVRFSREQEYALYEFQTGAAPYSNASLWRQVNPLAAGPLNITGGADGGIAINLTIDDLLGTDSFRTHFPYGQVTHNGGNVSISDHRVASAASQLTGAIASIRYSRVCPPCPGEDHADPDSLDQLHFSTASLGITPSGGLNGDGLPIPTILRIGTLGAGGIHEVNTFSTAAYQMPGGMILPEDGQGTDDPGELPASFNPARGLMTPLHPSTHAPFHPGSLGYLAGSGNEAGVNFDDEAGLNVKSSIGGGDPVNYAPADWFRGYGRQSGFTGILQADPNDVPPLITVYGYDIALDDLGWSYLSNQTVKSVTGGQLDVPYPSQFSLTLQEMMINCCGEPTGFDLDPSDRNKELAYWGPAAFYIASAGFDRGVDCPNECGTQPGLLALGVNAVVPGTSGAQGGFLYPLPDGQLTDGNESGGRESHLAIGPTTLRGYDLLPTGHAHFNKQDTTPLPPVGFLHFPATMAVSYFEDIEGVVMTNVSLAESEGIHFRRSWEDGGDTFFTDPDFDPEHRGFDTDLDTIQEYRTGEAFHPIATKDWFGGTFDYPVRFFDQGPTTSHFRSTDTAPTELRIAELPGRVTLLTADLSNISFGAEFELLPKLTLSNLAGLGIDNATSDLGGIVGPLLDDAEAMLENIANLQATSAQAMLNGRVTIAANAQATNLVTLMRPLAAIKPPGTLDDLEDSIAIVFSQAQINATMAPINGPANMVGSWIETQRVQVQEWRDQLHAIRTGLLTEEAMEDFITAMVSTVPNVAVDESLIEEIWVEMLGTGPADSALKLLQDRADELLAALDEAIIALDVGGEIVVEAQAAANNIVSSYYANISLLEPHILNYLSATLCEDPDAYSDAELIATISGMIRDAVLELDAVSALHSVVRNAIYHVAESSRELIAAVLDFANGAAKTVASTVLFIPDAPLRAVQGFGTHFLTGGLNGYAQTAGDDMVKLRLDGRLGLHLPTQVEFKGYLEYLQLTSQGGGFCGNPDGVRTHELLVGANGSYSQFMRKTRKLSVDGKFSFNGDKQLTGMAGSVEMLSGNFSWGGMNAQKTSFHMAVGQQEFYLAGGVNAELNRVGIALTGGFFTGRTCDAGPLAWLPGDEDDHFDGFLPYTSEFAGGVMYAEGAANVIGRTCLARLRVGGGAGWYMQAPLNGSNQVKWGARLKGTASGELLCIINGKGEIVLDGGRDGMNGRASVSRRTIFGKKKTRSINVGYERGDGFSFRR